MVRATSILLLLATACGGEPVEPCSGDSCPPVEPCADTGGICPVSRCAKSLFNGPCGGTQDGHCEVDETMPCAWHVIWERMDALGLAEQMLAAEPPKNRSTSRDGGVRRIVREDLRLPDADAAADSLSRSVNARAFTTGQDIFFSETTLEVGRNFCNKIFQATKSLYQEVGRILAAHVSYDSTHEYCPPQVIQRTSTRSHWLGRPIEPVLGCPLMEKTANPADYQF